MSVEFNVNLLLTIKEPICFHFNNKFYVWKSLLLFFVLNKPKLIEFH